MKSILGSHPILVFEDGTINLPPEPPTPVNQNTKPSLYVSNRGRIEHSDKKSPQNPNTVLIKIGRGCPRVGGYSLKGGSHPVNNGDSLDVAVYRLV